ncbi:MAG: PHP domain-containing protein [Eubacterium sp.]|nr:PHP domain-containing protein [Eubacterium sp.]MBR4242085.1 PHP domain-containing protein [Eubacterium sp.]MBR7060653.1 PHP domain-containing protein [Eubacterium sp.]
MNRYYYDLHIHSCLSPCASDDNTPNNIAGMATLCGLNIVALTDHNTCKNCPAFFEAAKRYGIIPVAGMELTTAEDIHVICLFENLENAMAFDEEIDKRRIKIENRTDIFGNQFILDGEDNIIGEDKYLLSNATTVSLEEVPKLVGSFGGISYPAHIDRPANGVIEVLGTFPETPYFGIVEISRREKVEEYIEKYSLEDKKVIISSDAHYLENMRDKENYFELDDEPYSSALVRSNLFKFLR